MHPRSLVSAFVIRVLESCICKLGTGEFQFSRYMCSLCSWGDRFETRFDGNPKDRLSHDEAYIASTLFGKCGKWCFAFLRVHSGNRSFLEGLLLVITYTQIQVIVSWFSQPTFDHAYLKHLDPKLDVYEYNISSNTSHLNLHCLPCLPHLVAENNYKNNR